MGQHTHYSTNYMESILANTFLEKEKYESTFMADVKFESLLLIEVSSEFIFMTGTQDPCSAVC